ncbi:heterokaryon incompatibility protein-domain-containing protein [Suillus lakei]|nr:heterokaryon incompatibility protein-domain-containing protein [Suillus lakei]
MLNAAITTSLYNSAKRVTMLMGRTLSLSWGDPNIREWNTSTWKQVGHRLNVHAGIATHPAGAPITSASTDSHVRLSDRRTLWTSCATFSVDGKHILSGGQVEIISQWAVSKDALPEKPASKAQVSSSKILAINAKSVTIQPSPILNSASGAIYANRCKAKLVKMLWEDALLDAQKVIELEPSSHVGYQLKHAALHGAQRYSEAIEASQMMLAKLAGAHVMQIRKLHEKHVSPYKAEGLIRKVIDVQLDVTPLRLLDTTTGLLCDREAQISAFKTTTAYHELLSSMMTHPDLPMERVTEVVATYFRYVMLSHRWGDNEPLLHDIQDKIVYKLKPAGGLMKLQSFCKLARHSGYRWAWVDTCCIDQNNHVELQKSLNSTFAWYRHSALTVVYLSDVPPSSKAGALAKSDWNTRGWTVPEFLAPKTIRFYQQDWTPYLDDDSPNHKESVEIMHELEDATGIDIRALVAFQPGMRDAREKLQWASTRVTTIPEDIAYSLFGIFGIQLPILYGENAQNALGRLLQEIVARSGDITALDWVGQPSEFNSCLPAHISSYAVPPCALPHLSEGQIQTAVSSLRHAVTVSQASTLHDRLENVTAPRFANCRLRLPCIVFPVTEVRRRPGPAQETLFTYEVKADGLDDLLVTTEEKLIQFSRLRPTRQTFLLVRPWDRRLLELPDFSDDADSLGGRSEPESFSSSPREEELAESHSRALRLIARLGQPFGAFLLAQQRGGEYKRIASDHNIIAQVKDVTSVHSMMDMKTLEIL